MIKTNMTLTGKIFMCLFFFAAGFGTCAYIMKKSSNENQGNQISVSVDGKVKKGSEVIINLDADQKQEKKNRRKKKR